MIHVDIIHRSARFIEGADYMSRKGGNCLYDPLINEHSAFVATLRKNVTAPNGPILPQHMPGYRCKQVSGNNAAAAVVKA